MNIFYTDKDPKLCATNQCDQHVIKMSTEYGQMLSTAHRVLDGKSYIEKSINNRKLTRWKLDDEREQVLWKACHVNHPSNIWLRESKENYMWLFLLWSFTVKEYHNRYGKVHKSIELYDFVKRPPLHILLEGWSEPPLAMPEEYKTKSTVQSYINFYNGSKSKFAQWKFSQKPVWYTGVYNASL